MFLTSMASSGAALRLRPALQLSSICKARVVQNRLPATSVSWRSFRTSSCRREQYLDADKETFTKAISGDTSKGRVVLVDFYADWCGPCKMLSPILEKLTEPGNTTLSGSGLPVDLVTVDTDAEQDLAVNFGISALPTVVAFKNGEPVLKFSGAIPEPQVKDFISKL